MRGIIIKRRHEIPGHTNNAAMNEAAQQEYERLREEAEDSHIDGWKHAECVKRVCQRYITGLKAELATLRNMIADYQKAGDSAKEMEAQNKALRAENARLLHQHDEMAAQIMEADVLGMKYKEECERLKADYGILSDDYKQLQVDNERLKAELVEGDYWQERAKEYLADGNCPVCFATDEEGHKPGCAWGDLEAKDELYSQMDYTLSENDRLATELAACRASDAFVDSLRADKLKLADEIKRLEHELGVMRGVYNSMSGTLETIRDDCATRIGENCQLVARLCNATMATVENKMEVEGVNRG